MNRLILLAATCVLSTGVMVGQSSSTATDNGRPNAAPDQTQHGTVANPQATPPMVPHHPPDTTANPKSPEATPETKLPSTTIDDQQPGSSSAPSSTMGTTGSTPGTEAAPEGNKSGTVPGDKGMPPETKPTEPHEASPSGSSNPSSSANGASSNDMSGKTPKPETKPDNSTNSTNPQTTPPHIATHTPDAGTVMNPEAVELASEGGEKR